MAQLSKKATRPQPKVSRGAQVSVTNTTPTEALNQAKKLTEKFKISMMKSHGESGKPFSKRYASISDRVKNSTKAVSIGVSRPPLQRTEIPVSLSIFARTEKKLVKTSGHLDMVKGKLVFTEEKGSMPITFDGVKDSADKRLPREPVFVLDIDKKNLSLVVRPSPLQLRSKFGSESKLRSFYDRYQTKRLELITQTTIVATKSTKMKEEVEKRTASTSKKTALTTGSSSNYESDIDELTRALLASGDFNSPVALADQTLDNTTSYDFSYYEYVLPTQSAWLSGDAALSTEAIALIDMLEKSGFEAELAYSFFQTVERIITIAVTFSGIPPDSIPSKIASLLGYFYGNPSVIIQLFGFFVRLPNQLDSLVPGPPHQAQIGFVFENSVYHRAASDLASNPSISPDLFWLDILYWLAFGEEALQRGSGPKAVSTYKPESLRVGYDFEVFAPSSVNIGLRHVYRQYWRPLAVQPGEVVRTIPLGPRQTMKVSTKMEQRTKTARLAETQEEKETTTESATTTKDSSEVVKEASSSFNWNVEATVSGTYGYVSGSIKAGMGGDSKNRSQQTSSSLNEAMQKTSTKLRQQSKISVSTEQESTFEQTTATEITNPNDEIAITYEYLKLQQQYELFTFLAEVDSIIYVAERVPSASEVNAEWVRRYGWILAKVLLDDSFAPILREVVDDFSNPDPMEGLQDDPFKKLMDNATTRFAQFGEATQPTTVGMSDIYSDPAKTYAEWLRSQAALKKTNSLRDFRRNRLFGHIRDNILHYCRAIWQNEDRDQRTLRYKKLALTIPRWWQLEGAVFRPADQPAPIPLHMAIDPTGPIGFFGNYAIYRLRQFDVPQPKYPDTILSIFDMFAVLRDPYVENGTLVDPALAWERAHATAQDNLTDDVVIDLIYYLPSLKGSLIDQNGSVLRDSTGNLQQPISQNDWGEYLFRKNHTDHLLLDSNNLYMYLRPGKGSTVEPFKQAHRFIDVLSAEQELTKMRLENERRQKLIDDGQYGDPDIEKVVVVSDIKTQMVAGLETQND